jgi:hypothetical protein
MPSGWPCLAMGERGIEAMDFCTNCGARTTGAHFCTGCGAPVGAPEAVATTPLNPPDTSSWVGTVDRPRSRRMTVALLGIPLLLAAVGIGWWLRPHSSAAPAVALTPPAASTAVVVTPAPVPSTASPTYAVPTYPEPSYPPSTPTTDTGAANAPDPLAGTPYWSVIVTSAAQADGGRATAETSAASLRGRGFTDAFVVFSSTVPSLNSGYWVAATGRYAHRDDASATSLRVAAAGFADAYPRCFGSSAAACGS